jgi:thiol-disulfide isomerase/thioredoxin
MGVVSVSPSAVLGGSMTVQLKPECRVLATTTCQGELETEKRPSGGPLGKYLALIKTPDNRAIAAYYSLDGRLEFSLPPGEYVIQVYGPEGFGSNSLKFTVPENQSEYTLPDPIELPPTAFRDLIGKPAPELSGIVAWKGSPTKLADQKGKFVLLHFWGYWCGQCVQEMPGLMELHEKFKDQDVAIVAVHLDLDGEVDSIKAFDDKMAVYKKDLWNGKDIPFPVALIRGRTSEEKFVGRWSLADTYGIQSYPKTILIDRESKVVREFRFRDAKLAIEQLEELLKDQKKP